MPQPLRTQDLAPGFTDPVRDSQQTFRAALDAMSYPGRIVTLQKGIDRHVLDLPLDQAQAALALSLVDYETPVWLDAASAPAAPWLRFHCGCRIIDDPAAARFAFIAEPADMPPLPAFEAGSDDYPDRSATLVIAVGEFSPGGTTRISGPGIRGEAGIAFSGLPGGFWSQWAGNNALFPRGIDVFLTAGDRFVGLPRTTRARN